MWAALTRRTCSESVALEHDVSRRPRAGLLQSGTSHLVDKSGGTMSATTTSLGANRIRPQDVRDRSASGSAPAWLRGERTRQWLRRKAVAGWMNALIAAAAAATVLAAGFVTDQRWPAANTWAAGALKLFALWCLAFLPGWLYVRFLGMRAQALWNEYVLTLHRLGLDRPWHLPEPPAGSDFHTAWSEGPAPSKRSKETIYRQKFEAYYGRRVPGGANTSAASAGDHDTDKAHDDFVVSTESLFPLFLATAVLAVGWSAVLWDTSFLVAPSGIWDVLKYGFLGAYAFITSMLIRRFFQTDLRPSAYATAVLRIMLVLLIVAVLHQVVQAASPTMVAAELALAFLIGFFPLVGLQIIQRVTSRMFRVIVPPLTSEYPLDQLDGLNLWYEARLTEEGVEDMQNLMTMNLVDVILHTRVPPGRLVDWIDQAFLLIHLDRADRGDLRRQRANADNDEAPGAAARIKLRQVGIRTATDLLKAFSDAGTPTCDSLAERRFDSTLDSADLPLPQAQLRLMVRVLAAEPGLTPVWNWQRNGVRAYPAVAT